MRREKMSCADSWTQACQALRGDGAFLVVQDGQGRPNPMTIGWASIGITWGMEIMTVFVRPSRHTFGLIEAAGRFSVCVPVRGQLKDELAFCGSRSGREVDKVAQCEVAAEAGIEKGVTVLSACDLFYECATVHKTHVLKENLEAGILQGYYPQGDFHTVYNGRILQVYKQSV